MFQKCHRRSGADYRLVSVSAGERFHSLRTASGCWWKGDVALATCRIARDSPCWGGVVSQFNEALTTKGTKVHEGEP